MDDSDQEYLSEYRNFFDALYQSIDYDNPLPVHIGKYNVAEFEIIGEIVFWCLEYLNSRNCPSSLIAPLCRSVQLEMEDIIKKDPELCGYRANEDDFQTLKLMQVTVKKLIEVCLRYLDNSKLCLLPPPPPVTPSISASAAKNIRRTMEDRHIVINDLHALFGIEGYGVASFYAVFDGHNGSDAAVYACSHIYQYLVESKYYPENPEEAFKEAFLRADDRFIDKSNKESLKSGTTAVCILIRHDRGKAYVAWLGDSQAILVNGREYIQLVNPHRPDILEERQRIEAMGGSVLFWGTWRVNGQLAVSRSIGDVDYKPYVSGEPDVSSYDLTGDEDFLLLASDGLWDVITESMAVDRVYDYLEESKGDRSGVAKRLVSAAKSEASKDNISVIVAWLDMSTLENGHFGQEPDVDVTDDLVLPPVLRNLKPSTQITPAPQKLDENAEQWLKTLPWSYADVLRKPAPKKEESEPPKPEPFVEPEVEEPEDPSQSKGEEVGDVAGEAESGEDSDEEWNYISGKENREPNQQNKEELSREDMESQLNPNAAEFVPVYSTDVEPDIASSPRKGMEKNMEDISIPTVNDFFKEIRKRPSDIGDNDSSVNGDAISNLSTKAVFGDDSVCLDSTVDSLSNSEMFKDTNPFATSQVPNFVQDHFSAPDLGSQENFSFTGVEFKPFSETQKETKIDFMVDTDKSDVLSPSSPVKDIENSGNAVNDISEISFGDGLNVEEIIRSKQDSPLLKESPEPGLELVVDNHVNEFPDEHHEESDFSFVKGETVDSKDVNASAAVLTDGDSSHQGPETSVDSEPEQDDVLVCPLKKEHNGIDDKMMQETKNEDYSISGNSDISFCHISTNFSQNQEVWEDSNLYEKNVVNDDEDDAEETNQPDVVLEKNVDMPDLIEEIVHKQETESRLDVTESDSNTANSEVLKELVTEPSKETINSSYKSHVDDFESDQYLNKTEVEAIVEESYLKSIETEKDITSSITEPSFDVHQNNLSKTYYGLSSEETVEPRKGELFSYDDDSVPEFEHSFKNIEKNVESSVENSEVKEMDELLKDGGDNMPSLLPSIDQVADQTDEIGKPSEIHYSYGQMEGIKNENLMTTSLIEEKVHETSHVKISNEDLFEKQEAHEELICPLKVSPLSKGFSNLGNEELNTKTFNEKEIVKFEDENESVFGIEAQIESQLEKKELTENQEHVSTMMQEIDADLMCSLSKGESVQEAINVSKDTPLNYSSVEQNVKSFVFGTNESNYFGTNDKKEDNSYMVKGPLEFQAEDSILLNTNVEQEDKNSVDTEKEELICPLRRSLEEELNHQESEEGVQNSSQEFTDEMSSSMIDHGEEKALPEGQSNQLDLVQDLQFEVQEKHNEADTESDSGFEIINASEASTIEMEMRYQSEKEAGAVNEKLLLDRNEAELLEKPEELVCNLNDNDSTADIIKEKDLVCVQEEVVETAISSPKFAFEPLDQPVEEKKTDMVNGAVTSPATPPATPAPGLHEESKEGLIAAAVAAAGVTAAVAAGSAAVAVSESKIEEKKSPLKKTDSTTAKAGPVSKAPGKVTASKVSPTKAPTSTKPLAPVNKPSTPISKPPTKPTSPTSKVAASKTGTLASKPGTPTSKVGAKSTAKPSTPTGTKPVPSAAPTVAKTKLVPATTAKPAVPKSAASAAPIKKPALSSSAATKPAPSSTLAAKSAVSKLGTAKSATSTTATKSVANKAAAAKPAGSLTAAKPPASKVAPAKPAPSTATKSPLTVPRPSAKSTSSTTAPIKNGPTSMTKPPAKPAPPKTNSSVKTLSSTGPSSKPTNATAKAPIKGPTTKAPTAAPLNKKPAAPTAIKKPTAPTEKSTKEASNKLTAKTVLNKKIEEKKELSKKEVIGENEEPPAQVAIVTTTNGHINLIENGIPTTEIVAEAN